MYVPPYVTFGIKLIVFVLVFVLKTPLSKWLSLVGIHACIGNNHSENTHSFVGSNRLLLEMEIAYIVSVKHHVKELNQTYDDLCDANVTTSSNKTKRKNTRAIRI